MAWLRKTPMYSVVLVLVAGLIGGAALGYYAWVTFGSTTITGQLRTGGNGDTYEWDGQRLLLQSSTQQQWDSTCVIRGRDGAERSVRVPRNTTSGMFNAPDFAEVAPQPGTTATITCDGTVQVTAGDAAVGHARTVNSWLFSVGVPALVTIPVLAALGIPALRRGRGS